MKPDVLFRVTAGTDVGLVRTNNEDNFILNVDLSQPSWFLPSDITKPILLGDVGCVMAVADGMGGANCGEVASALAVDHIRQSFSSADLGSIIQSDYAIIDFLKGVVVSADAVIKQHAATHAESRGMGTTLVMGWMIGHSLHLVWCGDSRAYVFNPAKGLTRLSRDHSRVQQYVDQGLISADEAFGHIESNIITRCLGDIPQKAEPDYLIYSLQPTDTILLCTDGLSAYCPDSEIEQVMTKTNTDINACRNELVAHALNAGGFDNVTVSVLSFV